LQCVALCCSVLQCVAVCFSVLQWLAVRRALQRVAVCCSVLQYVSDHSQSNDTNRSHIVRHTSKKDFHVAACCSVLQYICEITHSVTTHTDLRSSKTYQNMYCSVLQRVAVYLRSPRVQWHKQTSDRPTHIKSFPQRCSALQCVAVCPTSLSLSVCKKISTLQNAATHCNTLQHSATHCNTLLPLCVCECV